MIKLNKMEIGARIKAVRERGGWSSADFGELIYDASKGNVSNWESGRNIPNQRRLERIALIGNTSVEWILYGPINEYVIKLFQSLSEEKFIDERFFILLVSKMAERKISYTPAYRIFEIAIEIAPEIRNNDKFIDIMTNLNWIIEDYEYYDVEEWDYYRTNIVNQLDLILKDDFKETGTFEVDTLDEYNYKVNLQILMRILDMLRRVDEDSKNELNNVIAIISRIFTDNIFIAGNKYVPEYAIYGGFNKVIPKEELDDRNKDDIYNDFDELKNYLIKELNSVFSRNFMRYFIDEELE